ncbi:MAG: hypothetical protein QG607_205 [Patescibacteria group bacterium]|jgi:hypothetical protein|nr:hypothetical protein [Patescibacteria group bacterium]
MLCAKITKLVELETIFELLFVASCVMCYTLANSTFHFGEIIL